MHCIYMCTLCCQPHLTKHSKNVQLIIMHLFQKLPLACYVPKTVDMAVLSSIEENAVQKLL